MEGILVLLVLAVLAIPVLLIVALVSVSGLKQRVRLLEESQEALRAALAALASTPRAPMRPPAAEVAPTPAPPSAPAPETSPAPSSVQRPPPAPATPPRTMQAAAPAPGRVAATAPPPSEPQPPGVVEIAARVVKRWFTTGNVPVKVGMLVLLAGVASLLKYASDQGWLTLPPELRLAGVAAAALAGLVFGWRQRAQRPAFALALQGGAIGILLLVVFAAFKIFGLLPAVAAFALSVLLIAGLGVLAVLQDSRTLAVLGVLAGFLAPIWLSTGSGNHVALFSYYAVLNAAIFGIAWFKSWRVLNLLGFAFTWGIGLLWGVLSYTPDKLSSTQPFLLLFFAFYLLIPILHARRRPASRRDLIDGCIVFGTPLIAFSLQAALLEGERLPLAFCALGLAALYAALAWWLRRREGSPVLLQAYALLAVGFATLSVPLALSASATAAVFALEGATLVWLGLRQQRALPQWTGLGLQLAAAVAFAIAFDGSPGAGFAVANAVFMGGLLIALAGFASAWSYRDAGRREPALMYYLWGLAWWCGNALQEIEAFVAIDARADATLAFVALSGWLAAELHRLRPARALALTTLAGLLAAIPLAFAQSAAHAHPFAGHGVWAWLVFAVLGVRSLVCLRAGDDRSADWAQFAWWLVWPVVASLFCLWLAMHFELALGWRLMLAVLPWLALVAASIWRWSWLSAPRGAGFDAYRMALQSVLFAVIAAWWGTTQFAPGGSAPLPWLPLLNPMELAQLAVLALAAQWLWREAAPAALVRLRVPLLSLAGFVFVTVVTLRAVHHWGGIAWDDGLVSSSLAQTSLTVVWSLLGVVGWIVGSRRGQRMLWLAGAVLMGVVLAKLVLVDRQHLGNLLGIGSFIAYGLLCTLVGYFAPAPPRADAQPEEDAA
ncbi:DUF2339 domain-containing protein [Luteimonas aestuarii]|uniref:DUF2339 domain-containing protein n=1 Tax=Luteimonas aestuarii TaxID=453837 RepID=A0A4R5U0X4_9GAMM|nr:DUF2339 domain-containing protein [Luteimonas aestuarii]TDK27230.1 DUF2339 domain-containing protein [Luteimonas aestuarii]